MEKSDYYRSQLNQLEKQIAELQIKNGQYSRYRLLVFLVGFIAALLSFLYLSTVIGVVVLLAFIVTLIKVIKLHSRLNRKLQRCKNLKKINENELNIGKENIFGNGKQYIDDNHAYSSDLDLFGEFSVFSYINRTITKEGCDLLATFLKQRAQNEIIFERQEIVKELSRKQQFKEEFITAFFLSKKTAEEESVQIYDFIAQFEPHLLKKKYILVLAKALPFILLGSLIAGFFMSFFWILSILAFCTISFLFMKTNAWITKVDEHVGKSRSIFYKYSVLIKLICKEKFDHSGLQTIKTNIAQEYKFDKELQKLSNYSEKLEYRRNGVVGVLLSFFLMWDTQFVILIEKWFERNRRTFALCLTEIGKVDAYLSLSIIHFNHPEWVFPTIVDAYFLLEAENVAHPLINKERRVANDYLIKGAKQVDIITGSNMAGKSTFLRTLGVNMVLAFAGAPVCAKNFKVSPADIFTYMRIRDSLNENASSFYAELLRIKKIIEEIKINPNCFLLLDELLRGTNSRDKYEGSVGIVKNLIKHNTVALLATHDLDLTKMENDFPENIRNYHFDIAVSGEEFFFDYKLQQGVCKNFNASLLMKKMGISSS